MKFFYPILLSLILSCSTNEQNNPVTAKNEDTAITRTLIPEPDIKLRIGNEKGTIDNLRKNNQLSLELRVSTESQPIPFIVENLNWPDSIITSYNIYKNDENEIVLIGEYPYSESGNWYIEYLNYFNSNGNLLAFQNNSITHNSQCSETSVTMRNIKLYDNDFSLIGNYKDTLDTEQNEVINCEDLYDYNYQISKKLKNYLIKEKLK